MAVATRDVRAAGTAPGRRLPPITAMCMGSMALVITAGIYLAAHLPAVPSLGPSVGLVLAGAAVLAVAVGMLARIRPFAWERFFTVVRWVLLAYAVIAGVLAFVFVDDGTRGGALALMLGSLAVFAVNVPVILGFTVARYATTEPAGSEVAAVVVDGGLDPVSSRRRR